MFLKVLNEAQRTRSISQLRKKFPDDEKIIHHLIDYNMIIIDNKRVLVHPMISDLLSRVEGFTELFDFWRFYGYGKYVS